MTASSILRCLLALACVAFATAASARSISVTVQRVQDDTVDARRLRVELVERRDGARLKLDVEALAVPALGYDGPVAWECPLQRLDDGARACAGPLVMGDASAPVHAEIGVRWSNEMLEVHITRDAASATLRLPFGAGQAQEAVLEGVPAQWLRSPLRQAWSAGEVRDGVIAIDARRQGDGRVEARYAFSGLAFGSNDGTVSGSHLALDGRLDWTPFPTRTLSASAAITGGVLELGGLRVVLPVTTVDAELEASQHEGRWDVARFAWRDADVLAFEASAVVEPAALAPLRALRLKVDHAELPVAAERYGKSVLAANGYADLALKGSLAGGLTVEDGIAQRVTFDTAGLDVSTEHKGFSVRRLLGGIDWVRTGAAPPSTLAWQSARVGNVRLPKVAARLQARDGALELLGRLDLPLLGGRLQLEGTRLPLRNDDGDRVQTRFRFERIGYDSADGTLAATGLAGSGELRIAGDAAEPRVRLVGRLEGGELLAGPVYVKLPATPVPLELDASLAGPSLRIHQFSWNDPGVLEVRGDAEIVAGDARPIRSLHLAVADAKLDDVVARYARSWLAAKGYPDLVAEGRVAGSLQLDGDGIQQFTFDASTVTLRDPRRFALAGLTGSVGWRHGEDTPTTHLGWTSAELFRVPLGGARAQLESRKGAIVLAQALPIDVLGGQIRLEKLSLQPRSPRGDRYAGSLAIVGIEMAQLSAALGWPRFGGNLSGGIPEIEFSGDTIELHGGLDLYVFDGHLGLSGLTLERPFGIAPSLGADVHFENLDMDQVTSAFSFGGMSGRLDGTLSGLRLVDWSPVAFDAWVRTKAGGRMSYKAVNDLTAIGGGGLSDNLQTVALKVFDTFGFRRLGIRCRLIDEVCRMAGIDPAAADATTDRADDSYTIVEGSGVPRIRIIGHRRRVDWPTLVRRLEEATQGQAPIIK